MKIQSHFKVAGWILQPPEGEKFLTIQIEVDCPACGTLQYEIPGHHLRAIRDIAIDFIDRYPELTGIEGKEVISRMTFGGPANDPSTS